MSNTSGITSVVNDSAAGQVLRSAAAAAEATIKKSSRFSPCSVNELTSWAAADSGYATRRRLRADVTVSRALDRGGLKAKTAAGRLPDVESDGLRDMMRALRKQIWGRVWTSVVAPWLRAHGIPQEAQSFIAQPAAAPPPLCLPAPS
eukprot:TRINITY_DN168_c0_g3_i2.p2 TRINITY_DN168_c0_g3~~TRINITY_DN168_c0_g3_i2.p2  ORF type:complete len:147 (+),score=18.24 TRINITY_DN168_c0_g3_i2:158-598(+)